MTRLLLVLLSTSCIAAIAGAQVTPSVTFTDSVLLPLNTSQSQGSLSLGDFNGDGRRDFGIGYTNSTSSVRGNPSIGALGPRITRIEKSPLRIETGSNDVVLADVNGDGVDDWCRTEYAMKKLVVLAGGASPGLSSRDLNRNPLSLQVADLDGDHKLDYIVSYASSPASVLRGNGDATTGSPVDVPVAGPAIAVADLDGDGALDIISGGATSPRLSVSRGTGALTFAPLQVIVDFPGGGISYIEGLAVRSLHGGERPTLAVVVRDTGAGKRSLYVLTPGAVVAPAATYETTGRLHAFFADMNRDSLQDLVVTDTDLKRVTVFGGTFAGTWPEIASLDISPHVVNAAVAGDVSGDQVPDLVLGVPSAIVVYVNATPRERRRAARH